MGEKRDAYRHGASGVDLRFACGHMANTSCVIAGDIRIKWGQAREGYVLVEGERCRPDVFGTKHPDGSDVSVEIVRMVSDS